MPTLAKPNLTTETRRARRRHAESQRRFWTSAQSPLCPLRTPSVFSVPPWWTLALLFAVVPDLVAADWPHLRGPTFNAVSGETGLIERWPEAGPPVLWRIRLGQGYSALIAVGDRLYTQAQEPAGEFVACLDAATGRTLWKKTYDWPWEPEGDWPGPRATPTWHDGRLYFAGAHGLVGCLDATSGRLLWSVNVTKKFEGKGTEYGYACSPLVEGGKVFLPVGGEGASVVALDARDGSVAWRSGSEEASYSPSYPISVGGKRQIVSFLRNVVVAHEPETGRELWVHRWSESYDEHASWPVYEEPFLLTCAAFRGGARVLRLRPDASPELAWQSRELSSDIFSSLILDGHIYGFDLHDFQPRETRPGSGRLKCLKLATGQVRWATDRTGHVNVLAADGKLILFSDMGELILARATPARYEELARTRIFSGRVCWTAPTLHRGRLYVRNQSQAACVYLGDPARLPAGVLREAQAATAAGACGGEDTPLALSASWVYAPTLRDVLRWYLFCLGAVFAVSVLPALAVLWGLRRVLPAHAAWAARVAFGLMVAFAGVIAPRIFGMDRSTFAWPAALFVAFQCAVVAGAWARGRGAGARWAARAALLAFAGICWGYVGLCRNLYIPMGYGFLTGILPALPIAWLAARHMTTRNRLLGDLVWTIAGFSVYFWASGLFTVWKT